MRVIKTLNFHTSISGNYYGFLVGEFLPLYPTLLKFLHFYFGSSLNIYNRNLEHVMHRSNGIMFAFIIRLNYSIYSMKSSSEHEFKFNEVRYKQYFEGLRIFEDCFVRCIKKSTICIQKLSKKYGYAWRTYKSHVFILKSILSEAYYQGPDFLDRVKSLNNFDFTMDQLKVVTQYLLDALEKDFDPSLVEKWAEIADIEIPKSLKECKRGNIKRRFLFAGYKRMDLNESNDRDSRETITEEMLPVPLKENYISNSDDSFIEEGSTSHNILDERDEITKDLFPEFKEILKGYYALDDPALSLFSDFSLSDLFDDDLNRN